MTTPCDQCQGPLFPVDTLSGHTTCVECARRNIATAIRLRDRGQSLATAAHPDEGARVEAVIRQLAATGRPFSANSCRAIHGVKGAVVGATFTAMRKAGVIEACGDEVSTDPGTHGHRLFLWRGRSAVAA